MKYYAITSNMGWGEGVTVSAALANATRGGGSRPAKEKELEAFVFELDPAFPVTHVDSMNGHALHEPANQDTSPMGHRYSFQPYKRDAAKKVVPPVTYVRKGGKWGVKK